MKAKKAVKEEPKKKSLKEKLAEKKKTKEEEKPKKKSKKEEKVKGRGRPAGMRYVLREKDQDKLEKSFGKLEKIFKEFGVVITKFIENGNKSAAKASRMSLSDFTKLAKEMRKDIQEAKTNLKQEPVD